MKAVTRRGQHRIECACGWASRWHKGPGTQAGNDAIKDAQAHYDSCEAGRTALQLRQLARIA